MPEIRVWYARAHRLLKPLAAEIGALHGRGVPCVLLVPEQLTLQMERELLDRLHLTGFFTIEVLSPSRLSQRVLAAVGADGREPLSQAGQRMAVSLALEKCEKKLQFYQSSAQRPGFTEKLTALIADLKRKESAGREVAERQRQVEEQERAQRRFEEESRRLGAQVAAANQRAEEEAQRQREEEVRRKEAQEKAQQEAELRKREAEIARFRSRAYQSDE